MNNWSLDFIELSCASIMVRFSVKVKWSENFQGFFARRVEGEFRLNSGKSGAGIFEKKRWRLRYAATRIRFVPASPGFPKHSICNPVAVIFIENFDYRVDCPGKGQLASSSESRKEDS